MKKPVATDCGDVRKILKTAKKAKKRLSAVVHFDNRHDPSRAEAVKRIHDGAIGEITSGTSYNYTRWTRWSFGMTHHGLKWNISAVTAIVSACFQLT